MIKYRPHNKTQSGNIFFALFGAVAVVGMLGASVMTFMKGPLSTSVKLTKMNTAENQMAVGAQVAVMATASQANGGDCDADGYVEPIEWRTPTTEPVPTNGGLIPLTLGMSKKDPWGTDYGYCVWNHGAVTSGSGCAANMLTGTISRIYPVVAIVSAGPDKTFTTTCRSFAAADVNADGDLLDGGDLEMVSKAAETDDDIIFTYTYEEATGASGGLWNLKSGDPTTAEIAKDIEVTGDATVSGTGSFTGGVILPDSSFITCDGTTTGVMARNASGDGVQICDGVGWQTISGSGGGGGSVSGLMVLADETVNDDLSCTVGNTGLMRYRTTGAGDDRTTTIDVDQETGSDTISYVGTNTGSTYPRVEIVQSTEIEYSNTYTPTTTFASPPSVGNVIVVVGGSYHQSIGCSVPTVSDNMGNTYTMAIANTGSSSRHAIWYAPVTATGGGFTITATEPPGNCPYNGLGAMEVSGLDTASLLDATGQSPSDTNSSVTLTTSGATTQADELAVIYAIDDSPGLGQPFSTPSGWTYGGDFPGLDQVTGINVNTYMVYKRLSSTGVVSETMTTSSGSYERMGVIATFRSLTAWPTATSQILSLTVPSGTRAGDLLLYAVSTDEGTSNDITWPSGFTQLANQYVAAPDGQSWAVAYKIATGAEYTLSVTDPTTYGMVGSLSVYRGASSSTPISAFSSNYDTVTTSSPWTLTGTTITPTVDKSMLVFIGSADTDATAYGGTVSYTPPAGFTERVDLQGATAFSRQSSLIVADMEQAVAGATGAITGNAASTAGGTARTGAVLLAISPSYAASSSSATNTSGSYNSYVEVCNGSEWTVLGRGSLNDLFDVKVNNTGSASSLSSNSTYSMFLGENVGDSAVAGAARNIGFGWDSLYTLTTATDNTALGASSLYTNSTSGFITALGAGSLNLSTGAGNTALGAGASVSNTTGVENTAMGFAALYNNSASGNTALGRESLFSNSTGTGNTAVGKQALYNATTANNNTAVGAYAGAGSGSETTGDDNLFFGWQNEFYMPMTGSNNTIFGISWGTAFTADASGVDNVALGFESLTESGAGSRNVTVGSSTMGDYSYTHRIDEAVALGSDAYANPYSDAGVSTRYNTAVGPYALRGGANGTLNTGTGSTAIGSNSLRNMTSGDNNNCVGYFSCYRLTQGAGNNAIGYQSLFNLTTGSMNTAIGINAGYNMATIEGNTAIGAYALYENQEIDNLTAVGYQAMERMNRDPGSGGYAASVAIGAHAMRGSASLAANIGEENIAIGASSLVNLTGGLLSTAIGHNALSGGTADNSVAIGYNAMSASADADDMVAIGADALSVVMNGGGEERNIAIGRSALRDFAGSYWGSMVAIGYQAGYAGTPDLTGEGNFYIGYNAQANGSAYTYGVALGNGAVLTGSHRVVLGNTSISGIYAQVTSITALSDRRHKKDIADDDLGLAFINTLHPVSYRFNNGDDTLRYGFIAQEIEQALPDSLKPMVSKKEGGLALVQQDDDANKTYRVSYGELIAPIIKAVQELSKKVDALFVKADEFAKESKNQIASLFEKSKTLKAEIAEREARLVVLNDRARKIRNICHRKNEVGKVAQ